MLMKAMRNTIYLTNIEYYRTKILLTYDILSDLVSDLRQNLWSKQLAPAEVLKSIIRKKYHLIYSPVKYTSLRQCNQ